MVGRGSGATRCRRSTMWGTQPRRTPAWAGRPREVALNILLNAHQANAPGGIGIVARALAEHLPGALSAQDDLSVVGLPGASRSVLLRMGGAGLGVRSALARALYEQSSVARLARAASLVHLCDFRPILFSARPFLITVHDVGFIDHPEWMSAGVARYKHVMLDAALTRGPRAVICDSDHTRTRLLATCPAARHLHVAVIPLGVDPVPQDVRWDPAPDEPYFLTLSTIEPRKNHQTLLSAYRALRGRGLPLRWKVAGSAGHLSQPILADLRAQDGVDVLGFVDTAERDRLLRRARFVALPSLEEGFGLPVLDAFARGVPVVCSTGSALDELAGEAGVRVSPLDEQAWTVALESLADDAALRQRLSTSGRLRAERFSWSATAAAIARLYDSLRDSLGRS